MQPKMMVASPAMTTGSERRDGAAGSRREYRHREGRPTLIVMVVA
jgi:hypothetical protein